MDRAGVVSDPWSPDDRLKPVAEPTSVAEHGQHPAPRRGGIFGRIFAPLLVIGGVLLKVAGSLKFLGVFLAVGGYALIWGWPFGLGFVLLILVHELGHYVEAKRQGLNPQIPVFIPFIGAYVALRNQPFDPWGNALVSVAGPVAGGLGALFCLIYGTVIDSDLLRALAYAGFFLNLINLVPIAFLDGGHILRAWRVLRAGGGSTNPAEARRLGGVVAAYSIALAAALAIGMVASHVPQNRL
jgi:Zn-dependent protease